MRGKLVSTVEHLAAAEEVWQRTLDVVILKCLSCIPGAFEMLERIEGPFDYVVSRVQGMYRSTPVAIRIAVLTPFVLFLVLTRIPVLVPIAIFRSEWPYARRNPFAWAHVVSEFLFEETYEWVISPILSEGQIKAERFRYSSPPRYVKAWWVVAKTYATVVVATWNAGVASAVRVAISVWKVG